MNHNCCDRIASSPNVVLLQSTDLHKSKLEALILFKYSEYHLLSLYLKETTKSLKCCSHHRCFHSEHCNACARSIPSVHSTAQTADEGGEHIAVIVGPHPKIGLVLNRIDAQPNIPRPYFRESLERLTGDRHVAAGVCV
jgi:hypothetical protein